MINKYESIITQARAESLRDLTDTTFNLLTILRYLWNNREGDFVRIGNAELVEALRCDIGYVSNMITELANKKLIRVEYFGRGNQERRIYFDE